MALFSLNHKSIGKTRQERPYTAAAHVSYITRTRALSRLDGARMPVSREGAMAFFTTGEDRDRKNARVADKVMLALPLELTAWQRVELVRSFAERVTDGRAPWLAAFHDKGKDAKNPHCHLVIRDRDAATGRRVFRMSDTGSTERLRKLWEEHVNRALRIAGRDESVDRRTLAAQGIDREPTIHVGVRSREVIRKGHRPGSRVQTVRNHCQARSPARRVDFPALDGGKSRMDYNLTIVQANIRSFRERESESDLWKEVDRDAYERDMDMLRRAHGILPGPEYGRRDPAVYQGDERIWSPQKASPMPDNTNELKAIDKEFDDLKVRRDAAWDKAEVLKHRLQEIDKELNRDIPPSVRLSLQRERIDRADEYIRADRAIHSVDARVLDLNERREALGVDRPPTKEELEERRTLLLANIEDDKQAQLKMREEGSVIGARHYQMSAELRQKELRIIQKKLGESPPLPQDRGDKGPDRGAGLEM